MPGQPLAATTANDATLPYIDLGEQTPMTTTLVIKKASFRSAAAVVAPDRSRDNGSGRTDPPTSEPLDAPTDGAEHAFTRERAVAPTGASMVGRGFTRPSYPGTRQAAPAEMQARLHGRRAGQKPVRGNPAGGS